MNMSGVDEQYPVLISTNAFYDIYSSIRQDWTQEIDERIKWLLEILPHTTVKHKEDMTKHLEELSQAWEEDPDMFDGRSWVRNCDFSYVYPENWITDFNYVTLLDADGEEFEENLHDDAEEMYNLWKSKQLRCLQGD